MTEWQVKMKRHAFRPQLDLTVQSRKQNNLDLMWKEGLPQLLVCQLAVSMSWVCFHTSSERGHSGLPADMKIRTIVQLIGILWSYFGVYLGSASVAQSFGLSLCNPWGVDWSIITHMKKDIKSFQMKWGMIACSPPIGCRDIVSLLIMHATYYMYLVQQSLHLIAKVPNRDYD